MNSVWLNLLWKEWCEHRWKLAATCAVNVGVPLVCSLRNPANFLPVAAATLLFSVPLCAMFIGMGIAASEQSRGTIRFLQALPTRMARPAAAKLLVASVAVVIPVIVVVLASLLWEALFIANPRAAHPEFVNEVSGTIWGIQNVRLAVIVAGAIGSVSFLAWMAAIGVNRSDEIRAGAFGMLGIAAVWAILAAIGARATQPGHAPPRWFRIVSAAAPGGASIVNDRFDVAPRLDAEQDASPREWRPDYRPYAALAIVANGAMAAWFIARFARVSSGKRQASAVRLRTAAAPAWLGPPRPGPLRAIFWKQCRETLPIAAMGAGVVFCISLLAVQLSSRSFGGSGIMRVRDAMQMTFAMWMVIGIFVSVVSGLGVLMDDMQPRLHNFWRSRPIDADRWFAVKFFTGLVTTIAVLALPPLAIVGYLAMRHGEQAELFANSPAVGMMLLVQVGVFCAAVAAMALVRQPVYAAIIAFGALAGVAAFAQWVDQNFTWREEVVFPAIVCVPAAAAAVLAWLAVRYNWGWRG